jgi:RND family efflux transporter MFP subunit
MATLLGATTFRIGHMMRSSAIALALALSFMAGGCGKEAAPKAPEVRPVRTVVVDPKSIDDDRQAVGEIKPRTESDLGFRVTGKLISRPVDVGVSVKKGDVLARLDEQDFQNRLRSAEADVVAADAVLAEARGSEGRLRQLMASGTTTRANYDAALRNLRSSEAKLESAKAALALAKDQLGYAELHAEFDGVVTATGAEAGQVINTGQMVVRLAPPDEKDAVFSIAESAFRGRPDGDKPEIVVTLLSNPQLVADGVVREVSPVADPATRTYQVKVTLRDPPAQMRFGSSVVGRLKGTTAPVVVLPGTALFDQGGKPAVWVYDRATGTVALKAVSVTRFETDRVVLSGGLVKGEIVVTAGVNRLRAGQKVRLANEAVK